MLVRTSGTVITWSDFDRTMSAAIGAGLSAPAFGCFELDDADLPYVVVLELGHRGSRYDIERLTLTPRSGERISADGLRSIPVERVLRQAALTVPWRVNASLGMFPHDLARAGPTEDTLRWVARAYALVYAMGAPTLTTVAELLDVNRATLSRWVRHARAAGFLPDDLRDRPDVR